MGSQTFLIDRTDLYPTIAQQEYYFLHYVLERCGIPSDQLDPCFPDFSEYSQIHQFKLRELCAHFEISITKDLKKNETSIILQNKIVIAKWKAPTWIYKHDLKETSSKKAIYIELTLSWETTFETEE